MVSSRAGLTLAHVGSELRPGRWLNNLFWYSRGYWPTGAAPRYDFVIANSLDEAWLKTRFGSPRTTETCFGLNIWVYDRPTDLEFRNYLRTYVARQTGDHRGWWESPTFATLRSQHREFLSFQGGAGVVIDFPIVPANVIEIVSPTRKPLTLSYRRGGSDVAHQQVTFERQQRRLLALPASLQIGGFDSVFVEGTSGTHYKLEDPALMFDTDAEAARP
jgi:hypothetical protein